MAKKRNAKQEAVLNYFSEHKTLTSLEAITLFGDTRLPATVKVLKEDGHIFETEYINVNDRFGGKKGIAKYTYIGWSAEKQMSRCRKYKHCDKKTPYYVYQVRTSKKIVAEFDNEDEANNLAKSVEGAVVWKAGFMPIVQTN